MTRLVTPILSIVLFLMPAGAFPQSGGGTYQLEKSAVPSGGGDATGGTYGGTFTTGQPIAGGFLNGATKQAYIGFWASPHLVPTSAAVTVSGRVSDAHGRGISRVSVSITDSSGHERTATTNTFGWYRFRDIAAGQGYVLSVRSRRYTFPTPHVFVNVQSELTRIDFVAETWTHPN